MKTSHNNYIFSPVIKSIYLTFIYSNNIYIYAYSLQQTLGCLIYILKLTEMFLRHWKNVIF